MIFGIAPILNLHQSCFMSMYNQLCLYNNLQNISYKTMKGFLFIQYGYILIYLYRYYVHSHNLKPDLL